MLHQTAKALLEHPHEWVRTAASRLVGRLVGGNIVDGRLLVEGDKTYAAFLRILDERDISDELAKATLRNLFFVLCVGDVAASADVFEGVSRNARRNLEQRLKFVGMACSCGKEEVVRNIPVDVVCRLLVPVLEDSTTGAEHDQRERREQREQREHGDQQERARDRKRRGRDRDEGRNLDGDRGREGERERKALAKEVFNSIVGAVGHDRALRGYNAAKERRSERQRDRRARRARVDR
jgi:hypothetical protein